MLIRADTASDDPVELAGVIARDRARIVAVGAVGLHIPRKIYYEKELTFLNSRSYGPGRYDPSYEEGGRDYPIGYIRWTEGRNLGAVVDLLADGLLAVHPLITHKFPVERAPAAYELITGKTKEPFLGVLLIYPQTESGATSPEDNQNADSPVASALQSLMPVAGTIDRPDIVRLGVLGAGNFATAVLLPALRGVDRLEQVSIASASGMSAQHAAGRFGFASAVSDENEVLNDSQVNTIAILTRHHLHARQVTAALLAGKHVFCEKPLALNESELEEIAHALAATAETGFAPLLMVGFNRRFAPFAQQMLAFLATRQEPLAVHYRVNAGYLPLKHWVHDPEQGGGRLVGEGCHFIDFLSYLVGSPPRSVSAFGLPDRGRYREDNLSLTFSFADGSLGTLSYLANGDKAFPKERVEVFCAGRVAVLDDFRALELVQDGKRQMKHARLRQDKGHKAEWQAFSAAILNGGPPPIPYEHLFGVTRASFAAVKALRSGQTVNI